MRDTESKFPKYIDDRIFFQDIRLDQIPIMKHYHALQSKNAYTSASEFLNNSEVFFYGAWILNLLENRLLHIEEYLLRLPPKEPLVFHQNTAPSSAAVGTHWTSTEIILNNMGTWNTTSGYTWDEVSDYTWEQLGGLSEENMKRRF